MNIHTNQVRALFLSLLSIFPATFSHANQLQNFLEFSLAAQNQTSTLAFTTNTYKTKINQLGINWYEPFTQYFHGGLELGYIEMSQADNTLSSARFTSGEYAGLLLRFIPLESEALSLRLNLNYRHSRTIGKNTDQDTQFAWNEALFISELEYRPVHNIGLILAVEYQALNGEQRDSGTISKITEFTESEQQSYRFGVHFTSNRTGVIGIEGFTGFKTGTRLYFLRKF
ncbi:MAG: hypothetical protein OQK58_13630 [Gammaproteobacteria bacterium]|nr:hypothetical protein [Gammaproteobacteria bacterium]